MALGAAALLAGTAALETAGTGAGLPEAWIAAHRLAPLAVVAGALAAAAFAVRALRAPSGGRRRPVGAAVLAAGGTKLAALAHWVGGAAEVSPDPVLVWAMWIAAALVAAGAWLGARAPTRRQTLTTRPVRPAS